MPDALDLLVICAEAGLSLDAALVRVSRELEMTWPELSEEFAITAAELTYLPERNAAFDNLNARTNMASIRGVVNTLLQTAKFGTPLAQSLRVLAAEFREARMTRAEEKAARLPAMLTVPMIVFILPTLFIVVLGPAVLSILDTFSGRARDKPTEVTRTVRPGPPADPLTATVVVKYAPGKPVKTAEPPPPPPEATVVPVQVSVRAGDLVTVDADARALARRLAAPARPGAGRNAGRRGGPAPRRRGDRAGPGSRVAAGLGAGTERNPPLLCAAVRLGPAGRGARRRHGHERGELIRIARGPTSAPPAERAG